MFKSPLHFKFQFDTCYKYFGKRFKNGIRTPLGIVHDIRDIFVHIARRHRNMIFKNQIDNIIYNLENPDKICKTVDKFGNESTGYIKKINGIELLNIVWYDIITSYYPNKDYIANKINKGKFIIIWERE